MHCSPAMAVNGPQLTSTGRPLPVETKRLWLRRLMVGLELAPVVVQLIPVSERFVETGLLQCFPAGLRQKVPVAPTNLGLDPGQPAGRFAVAMESVRVSQLPPGRLGKPAEP